MDSNLKVYPVNVARSVISQIHSLHGHLARDSLHRLMRTQLFIDVSRRLIFNVLLECVICHTSKKKKNKPKAIIPLPVEGGIFSRVQVDVVGQPSSLGYTFIMVIVDCFTKYVWTYPILFIMLKAADK